MSARWEKEVVKRLMSGKYSDSARITRRINSEIAKDGGKITPSRVLAAKNIKKVNKSVRKSTGLSYGADRNLLFIKDKLRGA